MAQTVAAPGKLESEMIELLMDDIALDGAENVDQKRAEIARAREIAQAALKLREYAKKQENTSFEKRVEDVRRNNRLTLNGEEINNLVTEPDKEARLETIRKALGNRKVGDEELQRIDDELFWATLDNGDNANGQDFRLSDGSGVSVEVDPQTREGIVNVYDSGEESGLPLDVVLPTRWKRADEPEEEDNSEEEIESKTSSNPETTPNSDFSDDDDLFAPSGNDEQNVEDNRQAAPSPQPEVDDTVQPSIMGKKEFELTFNTIVGMWQVDGETWHMAINDPLAGDVLNAKADVEERLEAIIDELVQLKTGSSVHLWENIDTGERVTQKRFKALERETWDYLGEREDPESQSKIEKLEFEQSSLKSRLDRTPGDKSLDPSGYSALAASGSPITIRSIKGGRCPYQFTSAYFDGRTLGTEMIHEKTCTMNPDLHPNIARKLISENRTRNGYFIFRVTVDVRSGQLRLRGRDWHRRVSHNVEGTKINRILELADVRAVSGEKPRGDSHLTDTAMGAADDARL